MVCLAVTPPECADDGTAIGMNAGQIATSDGCIDRAPDLLEAHKRRYQRKQGALRRLDLIRYLPNVPFLRRPMSNRRAGAGASIDPAESGCLYAGFTASF